MKRGCDCPTCRARKRREEAELLARVFTDEEARQVAKRILDEFGSRRVLQFVHSH